MVLAHESGEQTRLPHGIPSKNDLGQGQGQGRSWPEIHVLEIRVSK